MTSDCLVRARSLRKQYGRDAGLVRALDGVNLDIGRGEQGGGDGAQRMREVERCCTCSAGSTGPPAASCGCSSRQLSTLSERALAQMRRTEVGFVFQAFNLLAELTAHENVQLPALLAGCSPGAARRRARDLLELVGIGHRAGHQPSALSGGQRQRVAIARALANQPLLILADEPTGNLDCAATREVLAIFADLHAAGHTLVIVTHDERIGATADRLIAMRDGVFVNETWLTGGTRGRLSTLIGLEDTAHE